MLFTYRFFLYYISVYKFYNLQTTFLLFLTANCYEISYNFLRGLCETEMYV